MIGVVDWRYLHIKKCPPLAYCTVVDVLCKDVISEIKKKQFYSSIKKHLEGI